MAKTKVSRLKPSADLEGILPEKTPEQLAALREAIEENGPIYPVIADQDGNIIDGRSLWQIYQDLNIKDCWVNTIKIASSEEKRNLYLSLNINRRQLTQNQLRDLIASELQREQTLKRKPWATRRWAKIFGCSHNTVQKVIDELERNGQIARCSREAQDGRVFTPKTKVMTPQQQVKQAQDGIK